MKNFLVILYVLVFPLSNGEPSLPNDSSKTKVDEDKPSNEHVEKSVILNSTANFTPSSSSESISSLYINMNALDIIGESAGLSLQNTSDAERHSVYHRVYLGQNSSGSSIYTSSPTEKRAGFFVTKVCKIYKKSKKLVSPAPVISPSKLDRPLKVEKPIHKDLPDLLPLQQVLSEFLENGSLASFEQLDSSMETESSDATESRIDTSLHNFVVAVNMLQKLLDTLDANVGSYRRLSTTLIERPQELVNLIDEVYHSLLVISDLADPSALAVMGPGLEERVVSVSLSAVVLNEELEAVIAHFSNDISEKLQRKVINELLRFIRTLRNDVGGVIESIQPVMEHYLSIE